jgi:hypothetical protein
MIPHGNIEEKAAAEIMPYVTLQVSSLCSRGYEKAMLDLVTELRASGVFVTELSLRVTRDAAVSMMMASAAGTIPVITCVIEDESEGSVCGQGMSSCFGCPKQGFLIREGVLKRVM